MGEKLYSVSCCTKIKERIHKIRNNFLISEQISFSHIVLCQNKGQVTNIKVCACRISESESDKLRFKSSQVKLSFIVIPLHVGTYSGTKCHASQDHGATYIQTYNNEVKHYKPIHN